LWLKKPFLEQALGTPC